MVASAPLDAEIHCEYDPMPRNAADDRGFRKLISHGVCSAIFGPIAEPMPRGIQIIPDGVAPPQPADHTWTVAVLAEGYRRVVDQPTNPKDRTAADFTDRIASAYKPRSICRGARSGIQASLFDSACHAPRRDRTDAASRDCRRRTPPWPCRLGLNKVAVDGVAHRSQFPCRWCGASGRQRFGNETGGLCAISAILPTGRFEVIDALHPLRAVHLASTDIRAVHIRVFCEHRLSSYAVKYFFCEAANER